ncbi:hypothetical protein CYCD_00470 [Tenuifilaceae bacterium CYCD]|nr:hypothetical protein CYCD_00470 [Tenuifilaceae bacterium CYCD]
MEIVALKFTTTPRNIYEYYLGNYDFIYFNSDGFNGIPMVKKAFLLIDNGFYKEFFPFADYAKGFIEEYQKEIEKPFLESAETIREMLLTKVWNKTGILPSVVDIKSNPITYKINPADIYDWGKKTAVEYKAWEKILETPLYFSNYPPFKKAEKTPDYTNLIESLIVDDFISRDLKECFIELLTTKALTKQYDWNNTDWKLYVIIDKFIEHELLGIKQSNIIEFILSHFNFPNKNVNKKTLNDSIKRPDSEQTRRVYTTKLEKLLQTKSN